MLQLQNITVKADKKTILKGINFHFETGKVYVLLGPNGSGKSTLAGAIMGHPHFQLAAKSKILFNGKNIGKLSSDKRARLGIFSSFQSPLALPGVSMYQLMRHATSLPPEQGSGKTKLDVLSMRKKIQALAKGLHIDEALLSRSLNEGFSGGEKKKMEILQAALLEPKLVILDEIDTGVDVDALKTIGAFLKHVRKENQTIILITHSTKLLKYLKPDATLVLKNGALVKIGDGKLATEIEKSGFEEI